MSSASTIAIKQTLQGGLIYLSMLLYFLAMVNLLLPKTRKLGQFVFALGFGVALASLIYRGIHVNHLPMQSMFEVFLTLGMLVWPISIFSKRVLKVGAQAADALLGLLILFPAGFIFHAEPGKLPAALQTPLFLPHVASYMIGYVIMAKAAITAGHILIAGNNLSDTPELVTRDKAMDRMVRFALPFMSIGLLLGALWGQLAFGDFWQWDPKESWSLATWLAIVSYFHLRAITGRKFPRALAGIILLAALFMLITLLWSKISGWLNLNIDSYHLYSDK